MNYYDEPYESEPEFECTACEDLGWLICYDCQHEIIIPCTECCQEVVLEDLL